MLQQALNNPNTQYTINGIVREVQDTRYTEDKGTPFQRIQIDDGQMQRQVKIWQGKGQPLNQNQIGQKLQFRVKGYTSTFDNNVYLSGFWNANAQVSQGQPQNQPPPQRAPQGGSRPPQQANGQKEMRIVRGNALNAICSATEIPLDMVEQFLNRGVQFILTGNWRPATDRSNAPEPDPSIQAPEQGGDESDIPF